MCYISFIAILFLAQITAYKSDRKLADTLPVTACGFILMLYLFSFFRILSWVDYVGIPVIAICLLWLYRNGLTKEVLKGFASVQNICIFIFMVLIILSQHTRVATSIEDIRYWITDAKALWANNGLADKYTNVVPEFGFTPPAIQLFKWFFIHMGGENYIEGLAFSGYMCLNYILALPLISKLTNAIEIKENIVSDESDNIELGVSKNRKYHSSDKQLISKYKVKITGNISEISGERIIAKHVIMLALFNVIGCTCLILLPSIVGRYCFEGSYAEITVGLLYGVLLWSMYDRDSEHEDFYFIRIALLGAVSILSCESGIVWIIFATVFWYMQYRNTRKGLRYNKASLYEANLIKGMKVAFSWLGIWISWFVYCIMCGRISAFTKSVDEVSESTYVDYRYYFFAKGGAFLKGLLLSPMYDGENWSFEIPQIIIITAIFVALVVLAKKDIIEKSVYRVIFKYMLFTGVATCVGIFIMHITYFARDYAYSADKFIIESVSKFSIPWVLGIILFIMTIFIFERSNVEERMPVADSLVQNQITYDRYKTSRLTYTVVAVVILLTSDYVACYKGMVGYRKTIEEDIAAREQMLDIEEKKFIDIVNNTDELHSNRVLYYKDASNARWNDNEYINYCVAPTSVVYEAIASDTDEYEIKKQIISSHARYVYVEEIEDVEIVLAKILEWEHSEKTEDSHLYRVLENGNIEPYRITLIVQ